MRKTVLMSAALLGLVAGPVFAQPATPGGSTAAAPGTTGPGSTGLVPGTELGSTGGAAASPSGGGSMTGMRPMRGQQSYGASSQHQAVPGRLSHGTRASVPGRSAAPATQSQDAGVDVPRSGDYRGGVGSPSSASASNITAGDTRSEIAPRLPDPNAGGNSPRAYLAAAQRALAANRTGAAQEALERAETRLLSRSTDPSMANTPDSAPIVESIGAARRALASRDMAGARSAISAALAGAGS